MKLQLLLLVTVVSYSHCIASEYCVRPTDSDSLPTHNDHCCQTLSQYINDSVHYFTSNTRFRFLPGIHEVHAPIIIHNIQNISLEAFNASALPWVKPQFSCMCDDLYVTACPKCALFQFQNVTNVTFESINIALEDVKGLQWNISNGITITLARKVHILNTTVVGGCIGIFIKIANSTIISNTIVHNTYLNGIRIGVLAQDTKVLGTTVANTLSSGIYLVKANGTVVMNSAVVHSGLHGIHIIQSTNLIVTYSQVVNSSFEGIGVWNSSHFIIDNVVVVHSKEHGIYILYADNGTVENVKVLYSFGSGVLLYSSSDVVIRKTKICDTLKHAAAIYNTANLRIMYTTIINTSADGIHIQTVQNIIIKNIQLVEPLRVGLGAHQSINVSIYNTTIINSVIAIFIGSSTNTSVTNLRIKTSNFTGVLIAQSENTLLRDTVVEDSWRAISIEGGGATTRTSIISTTITTCIEYGISIDSAADTVITNTTVDGGGISILMAKYTLLRNTTLNSTNRGIDIMFSNHTQVMDVELITGIGFPGIFLLGTKNSTIMKTTQRKLYTHYSTYLSVYHYIHLQYVTEANLTNLSIESARQGHNDYGVQVVECRNVVFHKVSFTGFTKTSHTTSTSVFGLPAVMVLEASTDVVLSESVFTHNYMSALKVTDSVLTLFGNIKFENNCAIKGGAVIVSRQSTLNIAPNANVTFENNHALYGGAIYIDGYGNQLQYESQQNGGVIIQLRRPLCFLTTGNSQKSLVFVHNSAQLGGDILYGGELEGAYAAENSNEQCLAHFTNVSNITPIENRLSLISSEPSRACHCDSSNKPDCFTLSTQLTLYPGQTTTIPTVLVGQGLGTVAGSVFANFLEDVYKPVLDRLQQTQYVSQHQCNNLSYTIFAECDNVEVVLVLTASERSASFVTNETAVKAAELYTRHRAEDYPFDFLEFPIFVNITLQRCPPGFSLSGNPPRCDCIEILQALPGVTCNIQHQTIARSGLVWIGYTEEDNLTTTVLAAEYCPLKYCRSNSENVSLYTPDTQCNYNHSGVLCGGCRPGFSIVLGSAQCLPCSNKYLALLILFALAGLLLVFFIKAFDITISSGAIHGLIFYANIVKVNEAIFLPQGDRIPPAVFISWLNLDLGVQTCFIDGLSTYWKTWLQFVFPFYIWILAAAIICVAKYSSRVSKAMGNNSVPVLATLFLLSYAKLLRVVITALSYSVVKHTYGQTIVWSADGNIKYLGSQHAPLFVAAIAVIMFLYLPYTLILLLGQWLHKCHTHPMNRFMMRMKPFLDAHYGCLKENHRYWFGSLLLMRALILLLSTLISVTNVHIVPYLVSLAALALISYQTVFSPYSVTLVTLHEASFFMNVALLGLTTLYIAAAGKGTQIAVTSLSVAVVFCQFLGLLIFKVYTIIKESQLGKRTAEWLVSFQKKNEEDEWELYERETVEQEATQDTESENLESCLLTYEEPATYGI